MRIDNPCYLVNLKANKLNLRAMRVLRHILWMAFMVCIALIQMSCSEEGSAATRDAEDRVMLVLNTDALVVANYKSIPDNEKMKTLRVIILHEDGTVEHNKFFRLENPQENHTVLLNVKSDEGKQIYFFANEESMDEVRYQTGGQEKTSPSLTGFFEIYKEEDEASKNFESVVNTLYFAPQYSDDAGRFMPIPMSAAYSLTEEDTKPGRLEKHFYVVRVATKFKVNFINLRNEEVTVSQFIIENHADKNFLMAHIEDTERNRILFNGKSWIEWLKDVSEASSGDDDQDATEKAGWLKDYELPKETKEMTYIYENPISVGKPTINKDDPDNSKPGVASVVPVFYLPESKNLKADATDGEQEYTMTVTIAGIKKTFSIPLPNLKALFRNTYVVVNVTFKGDQIYFTVTVKPWEHLPDIELPDMTDSGLGQIGATVAVEEWGAPEDIELPEVSEK